MEKKTNPALQMGNKIGDFKATDQNGTPVKVEVFEKAPAKLTFPPYWAKRKKHLKASFIKRLQETLERPAEVTDKYGSYKPGTFLHKAAIVTVKHNNGLWSLHILSEGFVGDQEIKEIRYKYLPDDLLVARLFPSRSDQGELKGIVLYEIP